MTKESTMDVVYDTWEKKMVSDLVDVAAGNERDPFPEYLMEVGK